MIEWIHRLNEYTGFFLCICALALGGIANTLTKILREVECLHEDYDRTTQAHERHHWEMEAKGDAAIAESMTKKS